MPEVDLRPLFDPRRVIFIGASENNLFSAGIARYLLAHGYAERLAMVKPSAGPIFGRPTFATVAAAASAGPFDLAIIAIPAPAVGEALIELGRIGCPLAIVESAGFAETGPAGAALQARLKEAARAGGVRVVGPNCVGVVNTANGFATTEVQEESLPPGGVALIAQSGVFGSILLDAAPARGLRLSKAVTMGNRLDLDEADFLEFFADDPETRVVAMYLEGVADGPRFLDAMERCAARKPVLVLKGGRTDAGARAIGSHTASLAGSDAVFAGALRQAGGLRVESLEELVDAALAFSLCPLPAGSRVGLVTTSGSQGILATDVLVKNGLRLAELDPAMLASLKAKAPPWMPLGNPLDVGPSGLFVEGVEALLADPNVDALLLHVAIPWGAIRPAVEAGMPMAALLGDLDRLRLAAKRKPILLSHLGYPPFVARLFAAVGDFLPFYPDSERAARALAQLGRVRKSG